MQLGITDKDVLDQVNELAVQYADQRAAELVGKKWVGDQLIDNPDAEWRIDEGTRELLRADVTQAVEEGWSNDKLASEIEDGYAFSDSRSEMIARTETAFADSSGNMIAYRESDQVEGKRWILQAGACPICEDNEAAGEIGIDEDFPSGDDAAPAHPNCECDVVPVLKPEDGDQQ